MLNNSGILLESGLKEFSLSSRIILIYRGNISGISIFSPKKKCSFRETELKYFLLSFFLNESCYFRYNSVYLLLNLQHFFTIFIMHGHSFNSVPKISSETEINVDRLFTTLPLKEKSKIHNWQRIKIHDSTIYNLETGYQEKSQVSPTFGDDQPRNGMYSKRVSTERNVDTRIKHEPACLPTGV